MNNNVILSLLMAGFMVTAAYGQESTGTYQIKTISGTISKIDSVGNTFSILTADQHQMAFFVPGKAVITRDTHDIGMMDIKQGDPVIIKYDMSSPGKNSVESIVDNNPTAVE